jgi:hypothetical protein
MESAVQMVRPLSRGRMRVRALELVLLSVGLVAAVALPGRVVLPAVLAGGALALVALLRDPTFDRRQLWNAGRARAALPGTLLRVLLAMAALTAVAALLVPPGGLFRFPRERPDFWLAVMVLYPLVSVYPQELLFRAFVHHRYRTLFPRVTVRIAVSAALFGVAHLVMRNVPALVLSTLGGFLFARSYERSGSLLLVSIEHGLLGGWIFTVGLGSYFYGGARLAEGLWRF